MNNKVELLAPVGSMESLYAAIQNGANAVYLGGKLFNARQNASNFDYDELEKAVTYAHLRDVRVYVTANILIDDSEMEEVIDYIKFLYKINVDAVIVQDLGLASLIRDFFPDMEVHGSTQMTINNLSGAEFLKDMGFTRVVLARETPIEEIKYIHENSSIELEAFIHGALCVSYSGQCLMSSMIGGRSGNRGNCAQPCRMPSTLVDSKGNAFPDWERKHILSPMDLNTLEDIEKIVDSGIMSLKIEGRMKRPEYVATVVKNYRKALDQGSASLTNKDKKDVEQIFNRGFTKGLMLGDFGRDFISSDRPDNRGSLVGRVERADKYKVYIALDEDVNEGDGLEFELESGEYKGMRSPIDGRKGRTMILEKPGYILKDTLVYKSSSRELLEDAKASYEEDKIKYPIDMEIDIRIGENPKLLVRSNGKRGTSISDKIVEKAERLGLSEDRIREQLSKLGDTTYNLNDIKINLDENSYLPVSVLNSLRRQAIEEMDSLVEDENKKSPIDEEDYIEKKKKVFSTKRQTKKEENLLSVKLSNINQFNQLDLDKIDRVYLNFRDNLKMAIKKAKENKKEVYISTEKILYQEDLEELGKLLKPIEKIIDGVSVGNLGTLKYIQDNFNLKIHGDMGLNIFNSHTLKFLNKVGLESMTYSPELTLNQIRTIEDNSNIKTEAIIYGHLVVMTTKNCPMSLVKGCKDDSGCESCEFAKAYAIKDRIGVNFQMERKETFTNIYNAVPLMVLDNLKEIYNSGVSMGRLDFTLETTNIRDTQKAYYDYAKGLISDIEARDFIEDFRFNKSITNGHYFRGVM